MQNETELSQIFLAQRKKNANWFFFLVVVAAAAAGSKRITEWADLKSKFKMILLRTSEHETFNLRRLEMWL